MEGRGSSSSLYLTRFIASPVSERSFRTLLKFCLVLPAFPLFASIKHHQHHIQVTFHRFLPNFIPCAVNVIPQVELAKEKIVLPLNQSSLLFGNEKLTPSHLMSDHFDHPLLILPPLIQFALAIKQVEGYIRVIPCPLFFVSRLRFRLKIFEINLLFGTFKFQ